MKFKFYFEILILYLSCIYYKSECLQDVNVVFAPDNSHKDRHD